MSEQDDRAAVARRTAAGPTPSHLVEARGAQPPSPVIGAEGDPPASSAADNLPETAAPFDPLRLCIFATIALLGWLAGPVALVVFSAVGFAGYWKARRAGLTRSKCYLRDTRLVLAYLAVLTAAGLWGVYAAVHSLVT